MAGDRIPVPGKRKSRERGVRFRILVPVLRLIVSFAGKNNVLAMYFNIIMVAIGIAVCVCPLRYTRAIAILQSVSFIYLNLLWST